MTTMRKVHGVNNGRLASSSESSVEEDNGFPNEKYRNNRHQDVDTRVCVLNTFILDDSILAEYSGKGVDKNDDDEDDATTQSSSEDFDVEDNKISDCDGNSSGDGGKRKSDTISSELLSWVKNVAVNSCDDSKVGLTGNNKNPKGKKSYGAHDDDEMVWKKVLLYREAAYSNKRFRSSSEQEFWKSQKMCPLLYDEELKKDDGIYNLRKKLKNNCKGRFSAFSIQISSDSSYSNDDSKEKEEYIAKKSSDIDSPTKDSLFYRHIRAKHVPIGSSHQAVVPEWNGRRGTASLESDSKWFGTRIWPSKHAMNPRVVVERDPIGKGRQDSCGCPEPGLVDCVRFHVSEKRTKLKLELGRAFNELDLEKPGEDMMRKLLRDEEEEENK